MAENTTLARPYARAAFDVAKSDGRLAQWSEVLSGAAAVALDPKVKALFASPSLTAEQKSDALVEVLGVADRKQANFIRILAENGRLSLLPQIRTLFVALKAQQEKSVEVVVISAFTISADLQRKLTTALTQKLEREVKLSTEVDKSLLGGAVIRAGNTVIDGSVKGRLAKLAEAMNS